MRQVIKILLTFLALITTNICHASLQGGIEYKIPIDYTRLNQLELDEKACLYYDKAIKINSPILDSDTSSALIIYKILSNKVPENPTYPIRLGVLYDKINRDKYAKGYFYKSIGINKSNPEPYFYFGEFYYKRNEFKQALKFYKDAYKRGYTNHYETLFKIGDIYGKLGDTEASLKYLRQASEISSNSKLNEEIKRIENADKINQEYYTDTRLRLIDR